MPGTSASQMIFFIAAMIVATAVAGVFVTTTINLSKDIQKQAKQQGDQFNTQILVVNDPSTMPYNATCSTLVLYVKNIGSSDIDYTDVIIILNGTYFTKNNMTFQLKDGASDWKTGVVLEITLTNVTLASGDHTMRVWVGTREHVDFPFKI
jgi:flagellar protein FlaG